MNINEITMGMTPQEKEIYFAHMEKRHREEAIKLRDEIARNKKYKESVIEDVLKAHPNLTREYLSRLSICTLEKIMF